MPRLSFGENIKWGEPAMDWSEILEEHNSMVWRTITRLVPEVSDASDYFQATFIAAWRVSQKEAVRNWPALLRRLATARALERCRALARDRARHVEFPPECVIDKRLSDPAESSQILELEELLRTALANIEPREAEVFCLACLEGLTYREIGSQMDITVNHVGVLLNRARSQLRSTLGAFAPPANVNAKELTE